MTNSSTPRKSALRPILVLAFLMTSAFTAHSQEPAATAAEPPSYDVISVRVNNSPNSSYSMHPQPAGIIFTNVTLLYMLAYAYDIPQRLISGLPYWSDTVRYDISARVADPNTPGLRKMGNAQRLAMFKQVLIDRFDVRAHTEIKTLPVQELIVAKGGPKFQQHVRPTPGSTKPPETPAASSKNPHPSLDAKELPISSLVTYIALEIDQTVVDKTGLTGRYDFQLSFTPRFLQMGSAPIISAFRGPDMFTAVQEQLGLKLVPSKGPVTTLIVDQLKKPATD